MPDPDDVRDALAGAVDERRRADGHARATSSATRPRRSSSPTPRDAAHSLPSAGDDAPATVVVWTCNHCPYALAWHDRLVDVARDYADRGVRFLAVNSNDAERYPADSLEAMRERVAEPRTGRSLPPRREPGGRARLGRRR